jgi:hypothetical protein
METLLDLFEKYSTYNPDAKYITDKNSYHSYIEDVYDQFFAPSRNKKIKLLEIGVAYSGSVRLWKDYFVNGEIYGIDPLQNNSEAKEVTWELIDNPVDGIKIIVDDAYKKEVADSLPKFDFIIDDGPHTVESQIECVNLYLPKLKKNGVLFIEDLIIDFEYDYEGDDLANHPVISKIISYIPDDQYEYRIFDSRKNVIGRKNVGPEGRGDNVILAIKPV